VVKVHLTKGLSLRGHSQISFKAVGVQNWDKRLDRVQWRARFGDVFGDVTTSTCEDSVDRGNAICRRLNLNVVDRFQQTGRGLIATNSVRSKASEIVKPASTDQEETRIADPSCGGNDLTSTSIYWLLSKRCIKHSELDASNGCQCLYVSLELQHTVGMRLTLVTQWAFTSTPLEALLDGFPHASQELAVNLYRRKFRFSSAGSNRLCWPENLPQMATYRSAERSVPARPGQMPRCYGSPANPIDTSSRRICLDPCWSSSW